MLYFYDGQVRRYLNQIIRMLSNFSVQDGDGEQKVVPVMYGDLTRQVANIIRENSENKLPSAPRIAVYITALELDRDRLSDATYVRKTNIVERQYDTDNNEYLNTKGKNFTIERIMPTPYMLRINADIWSSNTDQKLQILEQILVLFNPSLEIQTTDNYIDWTSLTVVNLENVQFTNRSVPVGVDSEIDVGTLTFSTPIYISPPAAVKRLGAITNIITSMFDETRGTIELGEDVPTVNQYDDFASPGAFDRDGNRSAETDIAQHTANVNYQQFALYVQGTKVEIIAKGSVGQTNWRVLFENLPGNYTADVSRIYLRNISSDAQITGTFTLNELDETQIVVNWDEDSFPDDDVITSDLQDRTSIDFIIDPLTFNPSTIKQAGTRLLLLNPIGNESNTFAPIAWENAGGQNFVADANDIVEWDGSNWNIVFDASEQTATTFVTNLKTGTQYRFADGEWLESIDGEYPVGTWRLSLDG